MSINYFKLKRHRIIDEVRHTFFVLVKVRIDTFSVIYKIHLLYDGIFFLGSFKNIFKQIFMKLNIFLHSNIYFNYDITIIMKEKPLLHISFIRWE